MAAIFSYLKSDTFLSTILPVLIGGFFSFCGGYASARRAAKAQILSSAQASFVQAKLDAFRDFETAFTNWSADKNRETLGEVYRQGNSVYLISNEQTSMKISKLLGLLREYEIQKSTPDFYEIAPIRVELLESMRIDLLTYPIPEPIKDSLIVKIRKRFRKCCKHIRPKNLKHKRK